MLYTDTLCRYALKQTCTLSISERNTIAESCTEDTASSNLALKKNGTEFGKDYNTIRSKFFLCDEIGVLYMYVNEWITAEIAEH